MSLLCDPPTVLGNPLFIWFQVLHHLLCLMIPVSGFWVCGFSRLISVSDVLYTILWCCCFAHLQLLDTDVVHRQSFDTVVSVSVVSDVITKNFLRGFLTSSYFFTKISCRLRSSGTFPPFRVRSPFTSETSDVCAFPPVSLGYSPIYEDKEDNPVHPRPVRRQRQWHATPYVPF